MSRACLFGCWDEVAPNANRDVVVVSESRVRMFSSAFAFVMVLAFSFPFSPSFSFVLADVKGIAAARSVFGRHVAELIE